MKNYPTIKVAIQKSGELIFDLHSVVETDRWQGLEGVPKLLEYLGHSFRVPVPQHLDILQEEANPDLPWADNHFEERVAGVPTNPGNTFKDWPYYQEDSYRDGGLFTHTYQERFWPKNAGVFEQSAQDRLFELGKLNENDDDSNFGIRYHYGDLLDVIDLLVREPNTRQAYLPIFFPEDTGAVHKGRIPCTLGYLFNQRRGYLHMTYYIRSCDYIRHFKNDVYMAGRLIQWVLFQLQRGVWNKEHKNPFNWNKVKLGYLTMHIESFHVFETDLLELKKRINK